ncbi:hypothetical protein SLEP1_g26248 [Rubroshorea leprosula]|uniref:Uncharacterized protein n=1 Tax=Rubroshorea leprosula TaxID=152421 RepID=A0AAV5JL36_9ROSI|nr:hypothetical protein SLEP1_g26248 [Rubroshorea leprosula]
MWVGDFWAFFAREFPADPIGSSPNPPAPALLAKILEAKPRTGKPRKVTS